MRLLISTLVPLSLFTAGCARRVERINEVAALRVQRIPAEPSEPAWRNAPEHAAKLQLQDLVDPRLMQASTAEVLVRALTNGTDVAFRLEWSDATQDDLSGPGQFVDACAIQIPAAIEADLTDPQMGQEGKPVEIAYWRADWQASVNGRPDTIQSLYPNASVDHYPFQAGSLQPGSSAQQEMAKRYAPAAAVGNRRAGPHDIPIEDLISEGPGTLSPAARSVSRGKGVRTAQGWAVVIARPLPGGLSPRVRTNIAFAVWEGSHNESGARKMRTGWIPLALREGT
jgi:DMSO reductase family type II enzyme heme b subunit